MNRNSILSLVALVGAAIAVGTIFLTDKGGAPENATEEARTIVSVAVPQGLSETSEIGSKTFAARCSGCHGPNGAGVDGAGPPLVHNIYEPGHHGDESFQRAVAVGVQSHHWPFGHMPPQDGLTRADVSYIIAYIRELQRHNGIN
ncbi:MAG: c-type cytochrome [Deltaproteobacteria bacterium]|nr:c-type cytochrome [Deltaproteobacteria bacterium]